MPQPKKPASPAPRKATATRPKPATRRTPAAATRKPAAAERKPPAAPVVTPLPTTPDELAANLSALRERLVSSLTITTDRLQDAVDDAVRRGRMTRRDAEDLLTTLVTAGRAQTEALLADVEQLLGRGTSVGARARATGSGDAVLRTVDRARRRVGVGTFPILGYDDLTAAQITVRLGDLTPAELRKVRDYERRHDARKSVLAAVERKLG
jgi:polyhydroxyalkanoate synthesis regulator phasin